MRIFRCMVVNPHMHLELYLHQMLPSVMTVIANNRLAATSVSATAAAAAAAAGAGGGGGGGGGNGDHYALRIFAAQTLAMLVRKYAGVYRPLASVICKTFAERVEEFLEVRPAGKGALATLYGTIIGIVHLGARPVEVVLLPVAGQLLGRLKGIMEDRGVKLRKRVEAQHCHMALVAAVGEARERRMREPLAAVRIEMLGGVGVGVGVGGGGGGEGGGKGGGGGEEGNGEGSIAAESLLPYAAQSLAYPEHLLVL
jgi:transcription initiation factor TFIID subunit 6